jgi:hypothetical protein
MLSMDRKGLKILFDTYWTSSGWREESERITSSEDFEYAKSVGLMFDPVYLSHAQIVRRAIDIVSAVRRREVANAFVVSLSSRELYLRSALGSFAAIQHLREHRAPGALKSCHECGEYNRGKNPIDLNILNFERFKWGGVRHDHPLYAMLDLELFQKFSEQQPDRDSVDLLKKILDAVASAPSETTSATLQRLLVGIIKSNKAERDTIVAILGYCGVLETSSHPSYLRQFIPFSKRELPARRYVDMPYPACWWVAADGINEEAVRPWFGHLLY